MTQRFALIAAVAALLVVRLPSLMQPMGADQGLYAYAGGRILHGELPYRDAWDQKPPAIHYTYAAMRAVWPHDSAVPAADLIASALTAFLLYGLGRAAGPPGTGGAAALLFLLLSNPAFTRLGGVRLRAQCETFIALAVTAALLLVLRKRVGRAAVFAAGALLGVAFAYKYNAAIYALVTVFALWTAGRLSRASILTVAIGFALPVVVLLTVFAAGGAIRPLFDATFLYNLHYSGETYSGPLGASRYLISFPVQRARVDALWTLGGAGCVVLLLSSIRNRERLLGPVWVAAACVSIAVNGSRGLPQYFVQAGPALALAAGWAGAVAWAAARSTMPPRAARFASLAAVALIAVAVWRVNQFPKLVEQTVFDTRRAIGRVSTEEYLARYSDERKYSPVAMAHLADYMRSHSDPSDRVYVFGFSCAAYVWADRTSASRFFWSRPVIAGFNEGRPDYGIEGLAADLRLTRPAVIALQRHDWAPDVDDSAHFFMTTAALADWLESEYVRGEDMAEYDVWLRRSAGP